MQKPQNLVQEQAGSDAEHWGIRDGTGASGCAYSGNVSKN